MTQHKHLKARIRARMQKTRETYTTARRHLLNQAGTFPAPQRDPALRWHFPGNIAATTALRTLLSHAGVRHPGTAEPFSEALLFVLAGGIGVGMFSFCYAKEDFACFFLAGRHSWFDDLAYFQGALERFGLELSVRESTGRKSADLHLRDALAQGAPCIAWVDMAMLPHRGMPPMMQGGGYHVVTVYKVEDGQVTFGDLTDEPIVLAAEDFAAARGRIKKQKNRLLTARPFTGKLDLARLVRDGLRTCAHGLVEARLATLKTNFRLGVLDVWAKRLHQSSDKDSWERIFAAPGNFWRALVAVHECIETNGTGGGLCRTLFADGLTQASAALGDPKLLELAGRYADLGRQWSELANAALPDDVPLFARARELITRRAELLHAGGPAEAIRDVWARLETLQDQARSQFPLSTAEAAALRASLQERVRALHQAEVAAQQALQSV